MKRFRGREVPAGPTDSAARLHYLLNRDLDEAKRDPAAYPRDDWGLAEDIEYLEEFLRRLLPWAAI